MNNKSYLLGNLRTLLNQGFSEEELRGFCQDEPQFEDLCTGLAKSDSKAEIINKILGYAKQRMLFDAILDWAKETNPVRYNQYHPYYSESYPVNPNTPDKPLADSQIYSARSQI